MQRYILIRLLEIFISLLFILAIVFALTHLSGDPAALMVGPEATEAQYQHIRSQLGLDQPFLHRLGVFLKNVLLCDFGYSWRWDEPALRVILGRLPATIELTVAAMALCLVVAVPMGVLSAVKRGSVLDSVGKVIALMGQSMAPFWLGIMLVLLFAVNLQILPTSGRGTFKQLILPAITLGWYPIAAVMRITRSSMLDVLDTEYIKMVRLKGVRESIVIWRHALKNSAIPVVTIVGLMLAGFLRGAVLTETVFSWPGVGRTAVEAAYARDFPTVQAAVFVTAFIFLLANLLVDVLYAYLDPRIRYG